MAGRKGGKKAVRKIQGRLVKTFARRLRILRRERGISQVKLALEAGLHISFIGRLERAESSATLDTVETLARTFGVPVGELLSEPGEEVDPLPALRARIRENVEDALMRGDRAALQALAIVAAALGR